MYFNGLNYTLANEDARIEREMLSNLPSVIAVAGSGARVLPLLKPTVQKIQVLDISENQLRLAKLRYQAARSLPLEKFEELLGYQSSKDRKKIFSELNLPKEDEAFWTSFENLWIPEGILFVGKWENHLRKLGVLFRKAFGIDFHELFELETRSERQEWMLQNWPQKRLGFFLNAFANPWMLNFFLYRGHFAKGEEPFPRFLMRTFQKMLAERNPRESFFMQMLFLGELKYAEGFPAEVHPEIYHQVQNFAGQIEFVQADLVGHLQKQTADFVSLSDVPSYLSQEQIQQFEQALRNKFESSPSAWVARSFLSHPRWGSPVQKWLSPAKNTWAEDRDTTGVYKFHIFENLSV